MLEADIEFEGAMPAFDPKRILQRNSNNTADLRFASAPEPVIHRIWPPLIIAFGLGLSVAWACLLGYGLVKFIEFAF